jgi:hypothetical protein
MSAPKWYQKKWGVILPELTQHFQSFVDYGTLIPGWQQANHFVQGHASHVSASGLVIPKAPGSLQMAFSINHPDEATWRESYAKEYKGRIDHSTFDIISEETYLKVVNAWADPLYLLWAFLKSKMTSTANLFAPNPELSPSEIKIPLNGQKQNAMLRLSYNQLFDSCPHLQFGTVPH